MKGKLPLIILAAIFVCFVVLVAVQPRPLDWRRDYRHDSSKPFGAEVLYSMLPEWLSENGAPVEVQRINSPPFLHLADSTLTNTTYFFLNDVLDFDEAEARRLYRFAERGNTVVAASEVLQGALSDSLGVPLDSADVYLNAGLDHHYNSFDALSDSLLQLTADGLQREEGYRMPFEVGTWVIEGLDSTSTTVLGTTANGLPNLIRVESGQGQFILSSEPLAFTNAALTGDGNGAEYLSGVLAYVPAQTVLWDAYYKPFAARPETPLASALDSPALSWSLLLIFAGVLLFILFRGRRWQRPVPVIMPPANATVDFVRTVGRLYFQHGDHRSLVERKRRYFFDRLRTRLALSDLDLSEETEQRVIGRSGVPKAQVAAVFNRFRRLQRHSQVSKEEILELDRWLDRFYEAVGT